MTVTAATIQHLDAITAIEEDCFSSPWSRNTLADELRDASVAGYVALCPYVIGYTFMRCIFDEGHIENIAVMPAFRGRGAASQLMDALLSHAAQKDLAAIILEVRQGNRAAMKLYHKYGFYIEAYRRNYYTDPAEDAVLMRKQL
jgi:ribosomal-protein-alanine N-acetyltransferase